VADGAGRLKETTMHRVGLLISDHFQVLGLSTLSIFEFANQVSGEPFYHCTVYSERGGAVQSSSGFGVDSQPIHAEMEMDTWLVAGVMTPLELPASGHRRFSAGARTPGPPGGRDLYRRIRAGAGRSVIGAPCHYALGTCPESATAAPDDADRRRPHLYY